MRKGYFFAEPFVFRRVLPAGLPAGEPFAMVSFLGVLEDVPFRPEGFTADLLFGNVVLLAKFFFTALDGEVIWADFGCLAGAALG